MLYITITDTIIQDLYAEAIETLTYVRLEPVERSYLTNSSIFCIHQPARPRLAQAKPMTKPTLRPRCRSFMLARSGHNPDSDSVSHWYEPFRTFPFFEVKTNDRSWIEVDDCRTSRWNISAVDILSYTTIDFLTRCGKTSSLMTEKSKKRAF